MNKAFIVLALLTASVGMTAHTQTDTTAYRRVGNVFEQKKSLVMKGDQVTAYIWRDAKGNEYPIILHTYTKGEKKGKTTCYVIRISAKSGNQYRYFIPNGGQIAQEIINENL